MKKEQKGQPELWVWGGIQPLGPLAGSASPALEYVKALKAGESVVDPELEEFDGGWQLRWKEPLKAGGSTASERLPEHDINLGTHMPRGGSDKNPDLIGTQQVAAQPSAQGRNSLLQFKYFTLRIYGRRDHLASVMVGQWPLKEGNPEADLFATVKFVDPGVRIPPFQLKGLTATNDFIPYSFGLPSGWTLKGDSRGIYAEAKDPSGGLSLSVRAERSKVLDEMALATHLSKLAEKRGLAADLPEGSLPRKIQGGPCAWLLGSGPTGASLWLAFSKGDTLLTFTVEGPKGREAEIQACLLGAAKSFRWITP